MRERIKRDVWVPVKHPVSGERVNVRAMASDRILSAPEAAELEAAINGVRSSGPDANQGDDDHRGQD